MKRKMKYIFSALLLGLLVIWFIPLLDIGIIKISIIDVMKMEFGFHSGSIEKVMRYEGVQLYLPIVARSIGIGAALILVESCMCAIMKGKIAYVFPLVCSIFNLIISAIFLVLFWSGVKEIQKSTPLFLYGGTIRLNFIPLAFWFGDLILIFVLSILEIRLFWRKDHNCLEKIYTEQIDRIREKKKAKQFFTPSKKAVIQKTDNLQQNMQNVKKNLNIEENVKNAGEFGGAILGLLGIFDGKVYVLESNTEVFFKEDDGKVWITP